MWSAEKECGLTGWLPGRSGCGVLRSSVLSRRWAGPWGAAGHSFARGGGGHDGVRSARVGGVIRRATAPWVGIMTWATRADPVRARLMPRTGCVVGRGRGGHAASSRCTRSAVGPRPPRRYCGCGGPRPVPQLPDPSGLGQICTDSTAAQRTSWEPDAWTVLDLKGVG